MCNDEVVDLPVAGETDPQIYREFPENETDIIIIIRTRPDQITLASDWCQTNASSFNTQHTPFLRQDKRRQRDKYRDTISSNRANIHPLGST